MSPRSITLATPLRIERVITDTEDDTRRRRTIRDWTQALRNVGAGDVQVRDSGSAVELSAKLTVRQALAVGEHPVTIAERFGSDDAYVERLDQLFEQFLCGPWMTGKKHFGVRRTRRRRTTGGERNARPVGRSRRANKRKK